MSEQKILLLGNPKLYEICRPLQNAEFSGVGTLARDLRDTLWSFREQYHAGRAIAAPQIGVMKRVIYLHIDKPVVIVNPQILNTSNEMITLWDDCMCFPDLLVKVRRYKTCTLRYLDDQRKLRQMDLQDDLSELLQHEYDHLDGILAVSKAVDGKSFALKSEQSYVSEDQND